MRPFLLAATIAAIAAPALAPALAQEPMTVEERPEPRSIRAIAGSASTGQWSPSHVTARDQALATRSASDSAIRLCAQLSRASDCQVLATFGPGAACGTIARSTPGFIVAGTGPTPEAARAAALQSCQASGRRCQPSARVYCYR
jgi:hypothetical protein